MSSSRSSSASLSSPQTPNTKVAIKDGMILGLLTQFECLVLSETVMSTSSNLSQQQVERMRSIQKAKLDEKVFHKDHFTHKLSMRNEMDGMNWAMNQETQELLIQEWEKRFDDKQLFRPNLNSMTQCIIQLCDNANNTNLILRDLRRMLEQYSVTQDVPFMQLFAKKRKKQYPGKEMPPIDLEQFDESIDCYLLQTMRHCFDHYHEVHSGEHIELCAEILDSCFARITLDIPYGIRYQAALLIGSLSQVFLETIIDYYMIRFDKMNPKKDTEVKEYAVYQQTMKLLSYSFARSPNGGILKFMQSMLSKVPQVKKGSSVLYPEICSSLSKLFSDLLSLTNWMVDQPSSVSSPPATPTSPTRDAESLKISSLNQDDLATAMRHKAEWEVYISKKENENQFTKLFFDIYEMMQKIAGKSKHRLSCTMTMLTMLARFSETLYQQKKGSELLDSVLKLVAAGMKEKKERVPIFAAYVQYLKFSPEKFLMRDVVKISNFVSIATGILFNKKTVLAEDECRHVEQFLIEYARINLPACCKLLEDILRSQSGIEKKTLAFNAMSTIVERHQQEFTQFNAVLGSLVAENLLDERNLKEVQLLKSVLNCLPRVRPSAEEQMKKLRSITANCLLHTDPEIVTSASMALQKSVELETNVGFLDVLDNYLRVLLRTDEIDPESGIRLLSDLCTCIEVFIDCCRKQSIIKTKIDTKLYVDLRQKLEGLALIWMIHPTHKVRAKGIQLLVTLTRSDLRALLNVPDEPPYLLDDQLHLETCNENDQSTVDSAAKNYILDIDALWKSIKTMCASHIESPSIGFAWSELIKRWNSHLSHQQQSMTNKQVVLLKHQAKFMCITLVSANIEKVGPFILELIVLLNSKNKLLHEKLHIAVLDALYSVPEERLKVVFGQLKTVGVQRSTVREKKKERVESSDLVFEENVLRLCEKYICDVISSDYLFQKDETGVRDFYEQLVMNWTMKDLDVDDIPGSALSADTWKLAAHITQMYFTLLHDSCMTSVKNSPSTPLEDEINLKSPMVLKRGVPTVRKSVFDFISLSNPLASIDPVAVQALKSVLKFGDIQNFDSVVEILEYFHAIISHYKIEDEQVIIEGMATLLEYNPQALKTYMNNTRAELLKSADGMSADFARTKRMTHSKTFSGTSPHTSSASFVKSSKKDMLELEIQQREWQQHSARFEEAVHDICGFYMQAIALVMRSKLEEWVETQEYWRTTVGYCLFLGLTNACASNNPRLRYGALDLVKTVCDTHNNELDYGYSLIFHSADDEVMFVPSVMEFSSYCASRDPKLTADIFAEAERLILDVNDYNREIILRMLEPWAYNYGRLLQQSIEEEKRVIYSSPQQIIKSIFNMTRKLTDMCQEKEQAVIARPKSVMDTPVSVTSTKTPTPKKTESSPVTDKIFSGNQDTINKTGRNGLLITESSTFSGHLEKIWYQLMRSREVCSAVSKLVIDLIMGEYEFPSGKPFVTQRMLRNITCWCTRDTQSTSAILEHLMHYINRFKTELPQDKLELALWQLKNGVDPQSENSSISNAETYVFQILSMLSYEHSLAFIPHIPVLFVNVVVLLNSTQSTPRREGSMLLENLFQTLVIKKRKSDTHLKEAIEFMKVHFRERSGALRHDIKYSRDAHFLQTYVKFLAEHCPNLATDISTLALISAIEAKDRNISLESFHVFYHLNEHYNCDLIETLSVCLFEAVRVRNPKKVSIILSIVDKTPHSVMSQPKVLSYLVRIAFFMLYSWNREHFVFAMSLLCKLQALEVPDMNNIMFKAWEGVCAEPVDVALTKCIFKGLYSFDTFDQTLAMFENLATRFTSHLEKNNMLIAAVAMTHMMLISTGDLSRVSSFASFTQLHPQLQEIKLVFDKCAEKFVSCFYSNGVDQSSEAYETTLTWLISHFVHKYTDLFGNKNGSSAMWVLMNILMYGAKSWVTPSIALLAKLFPSIYTLDWSAQDCTLASFNLKECASDSNSIIAKNAQKALTLLQAQMNSEKHWPIDQVQSMFNYLSPVRGYEQALRSALAATQVRDNQEQQLLIGATDDNINKARERMLRAMWVQVLDLSATSGEQVEILQRMIDGSTLGVVDRTGSFRRSTVTRDESFDEVPPPPPASLPTASKTDDKLEEYVPPPPSLNDEEEQVGLSEEEL